MRSSTLDPAVNPGGSSPIELHHPQLASGPSLCGWLNAKVTRLAAATPGSGESLRGLNTDMSALALLAASTFDTWLAVSQEAGNLTQTTGSMAPRDGVARAARSRGGTGRRWIAMSSLLPFPHAGIGRRGRISGGLRRGFCPNGCPCRLRPTMDGAPDLIITDTSLLTGGTFQPRAGAVAVKDGRIVALGTPAELRDLADATTDVRSMPGCLVVPGFQDAHVHPAFGGRNLLRVHLDHLGTVDGLPGSHRRVRRRQPRRAVDHREGAGRCTSSPAEPRARRTWTGSSPIARCS